MEIKLLGRQTCRGYSGGGEAGGGGGGGDGGRVTSVRKYRVSLLRYCVPWTRSRMRSLWGKKREIPLP